MTTQGTVAVAAERLTSRARPRATARTAGVFYVLEGATSAYGAIHVVSQLTVSGNAAATAASVLGHQALVWVGFGLARDTLALISLNLNHQAFDIYLVFFGLWLALIGCLIVRSTFIPTSVGVLAVCGGLCYVTLLAPPLASCLYPWYLAPDVIGEPVLMLWLLIVGLNPQRWLQQAGEVSLGAR
jgi:hypothetical protein